MDVTNRHSYLGLNCYIDLVMVIGSGDHPPDHWCCDFPMNTALARSVGVTGGATDFGVLLGFPIPRVE